MGIFKRQTVLGLLLLEWLISSVEDGHQGYYDESGLQKLDPAALLICLLAIY